MLLSGASLFLLCPWLARAAAFPTRAVTIIVPSATGGAIDVQARLIAKGLSERLGQPVIVENRAGAGGEIGAGIVARAAADGYTWLLGSSNLVIEQILRKDLGFDAEHDLAPVALIAVGPLMLIASPTLGVNSVSDLLALARQKPGQLAYASFGSGTHAHLAGEMFKAAANVDLLHVPFKGGAPALLAVMGGQVEVGFVTPFTAIESIRAGRVSALAVTSSRRLPSLAGVPTMAESGLPGIDLELWSAMFVPAKTPREIITHLSNEIIVVVKSDEVARTIEDRGGFIITSGPDEVSRRIRAEFAVTSRLVKAVNLNVDG
ncbi:MAG TPA: tripartite tricarboxylate transporter substrate-binding protein [Polyangia bacterium]